MRRPLFVARSLTGPTGGLLDTFLDDPGAWLPLPGEPVDGIWLCDLHGGPSGSLTVRSEVTVGPGSQRSTPAGVLRPLSWRAAATGALFPVLHAELELSVLDADVARITLVGSYRAPVSVLGKVGDDLVGHRVAAAVTRRFIDDVATRLRTATTVRA